MSKRPLPSGSVATTDSLKRAKLKTDVGAPGDGFTTTPAAPGFTGNGVPGDAYEDVGETGDPNEYIGPDDGVCGKDTTRVSSSVSYDADDDGITSVDPSHSPGKVLPRTDDNNGLPDQAANIVPDSGNARSMGVGGGDDLSSVQCDLPTDRGHSLSTTDTRSDHSSQGTGIGDEDLTDSDDIDADQHGSVGTDEDLTESDDFMMSSGEDLSESDEDRTESEEDDTAPDESEDARDPADATNPMSSEKVSLIQRTVARQRAPRSRKSPVEDLPTGQSRSRRHKSIWKTELRSIRTTTSNEARVLRANPTSARLALRHRRSLKTVNDMCSHLTHQEAVDVFNKLKVTWMLMESDPESVVIATRAVLRQNPQLIWNILTGYKSTALDLRKAALDPTVSLAMNTHPSTQLHKPASGPRLPTFRPPQHPRTPIEKLAALLSKQNVRTRRTCNALLTQCTAVDGRPLYPISTADATQNLLQTIARTILSKLSQSQEDIINTFAPATFMQAAQRRLDEEDAVRVRSMKNALLHAHHCIPLRMHFKNNRKPLSVLITGRSVSPQSITVRVGQDPSFSIRFRFECDTMFRAPRNNLAGVAVLLLSKSVIGQMPILGHHFPEDVTGIICAYAAMY